MIRRRGLVTGMVVGAAVASNQAHKAQAREMQYQQQAQMQNDLAQAQAQANMAKQQQYQAGAQPTVVYVETPAQAPPPPPAMTIPIYLTLRVAHIVDEIAMAPYGIISVPMGATVRLVRGTLEGGLGAPYQDYIEVEYQGRGGKISRLVVVPAASAVPAALSG
ncbi:hypothetical protein BASA82_000498 [Batrachochytrium salamandrivorans]|nr:hypothetical protein BASA82_000498 [Batrachochytrium salamandrivorans]